MWTEVLSGMGFGPAQKLSSVVWTWPDLRRLSGLIPHMFFVQDSAKRRRRELIKVEEKFKGSVKGKEAAKLRHISAQSGARVILDREDLEIYIISGTEEEREYAKVLIGEKVVGKSFLSFEWNL